MNANGVPSGAFRNVTEAHINVNSNKVNYPLTTGRKAHPYKSIIESNGSFSESHNNIAKHSFSRKLFSPQSGSNNVALNQILSAGKLAPSEKLMDRFIPCRMGENLQAKFEAVSQ